MHCLLGKKKRLLIGSTITFRQHTFEGAQAPFTDGGLQAQDQAGDGLGNVPKGAAYGWHAFRHGAGTTLWDLTRDKLTVRDLLRHGNTSITERYLHGIDPRLQEAQDKLVMAIINSPTPSRSAGQQAKVLPFRLTTR